ncbi:NnrS family protein [Maricurvus nonylphenolicus]|uniref:NnrS family protein n=1 Tax=Maricurvus nonylphenolicus TaxID=1008307 RepID=UPI0036F42579
MLNIEDPASSSTLTPLLRLAFRPLFLSGSIFSAIAMLLWLALLQGWISLTPYGNMLLWHGHEMLFGFVAAIILGFLLTAVQNWTGITGIKGAPLLILAGLWLGARLLMLQNQWLLLTAIIDLLFIPLGGYFLARPLIQIRQYRNLIFIPVLFAMLLANGAFHYGVINDQAALSQQALQLMIWLVVLIMTILGGRVIPFFTANGTKTPKAEPLKAIEIGTIASTILLAIILGLGIELPSVVITSLLLLTGSLHLIRFIRWRTWITLSVPLLWSLHAAYAFIPLGIFAVAYSVNSELLSYATALHALSAGAMGTMIISMMARVSLGHTGRPLQPAPLMSLAFAAIISAALIRVLGTWLLPVLTTHLWFAAAIIWCVGYTVFAVIYWPILSQPRADGRQG